MKELSVRGTLLLPTLVCPLFRMSSRTDFRLGNLFGIPHIWKGNKIKRKIKKQHHFEKGKLTMTHPQAM